MKPPFPRWGTGSPKRWCACIWSRRWNRCSTPTHTVTDRGDRPCKQWALVGSGAGEGTG
jgi:hypothetical protein